MKNFFVTLAGSKTTFWVILQKNLKYHVSQAIISVQNAPFHFVFFFQFFSGWSPQERPHIEILLPSLPPQESPIQVLKLLRRDSSQTSFWYKCVCAVFINAFLLEKKSGKNYLRILENKLGWWGKFWVHQDYLEEFIKSSPNSFFDLTPSSNTSIPFFGAVIFVCISTIFSLPRRGHSYVWRI